MAAVYGWRQNIVCVIGMVAAIGVALLLIPSLSVRAATTGGAIAIGSFLAGQLGLRLVARRSGPRQP